MLHNNPNSFTSYLSGYFRRKNEKMHNHLPPHLAAQSIRGKAEERKRQASGEFYREELQKTPEEHMVREALSSPVTFREEKFSTLERPLAKALYESAIQQETRERLHSLPISAIIPFPAHRTIGEMLLDAVRQFEHDHQLIPTSLQVLASQSLHYPETALTYKGVYIPIIPVRDLERNEVKCLYLNLKEKRRVS